MQWFQALREAMVGDSDVPSLVEARRAYRVPVRLPATVQMPGGAVIVGTVQNFSARGLKLILPSPVRRKNTLFVTLRGRVRKSDTPVMKVEGKVVWSRRLPHQAGFEAGLESLRLHDTGFTQLVDFFRDELRLREDTLHDKRAERRIPIQVPVVWEDRGGHRVPGLSLDLNTSALRFRTDRPSRRCTVPLWLILPDGGPELAVEAGVLTWTPVPGGDQYDVVATLPDLDRHERERLATWLREIERGAATGPTLDSVTRRIEPPPTPLDPATQRATLDGATLRIKPPAADQQESGD